MTTTDDATAAAVASSSPDATAVAARIARDERRPVIVAFLASLAASVPTAAIAGMVAGLPGVLGALVGASLVLVLFGAGAAMMMWAGRRGQSTMAMVAAGGVAGRLVLYAAVLMALDGTELVHRPSLAVATAVTLVITLGGELAVLARTPSLFRLVVPDGAPTARTTRNTTRNGESGPAVGASERQRANAEIPDRSTTQ
jgi:hypothetical protein